MQVSLTATIPVWITLAVTACATNVSPTAPRAADASTDSVVDGSYEAGRLPDQGLDDEAKVHQLDGQWTLRIRRRTRDGWSDFGESRLVEVPGFYQPAFDEKTTEIELELRRPLPALRHWQDATMGPDAHQALVELEGVDYQAEVSVFDAQGTETVLGNHTGSLGRFFFVLPAWALDGEASLSVRVRDVHQHVDNFKELITTPAIALQWGEDRSVVNRVGIVEPCRLRLVRGVILKNAFVATLEAGPSPTLLFGAEVTTTAATGTADGLDYDIVDPQRPEDVLAGGHIPLAHDPGAENVELFHRQKIARLPFVSKSPPPLLATITLTRQGEAIDQRQAYFINRRFSVDGPQLLENGKRTFLSGAVLHSGLHMASFGTAKLAHRETYAPNDAALGARYANLARSVRDSGARLLRPSHMLLPSRFFAHARKQGLLIYQDFALTFKTDYAKLPPDEIERQFDEFLWNVSRYPSVVVLSLHNEASNAKDDDAPITHALLGRLLTRARERAPHLIVVGNSGGVGTSIFPPPAPGSVAPVLLHDDMVDFHAYLGHWWQPQVGHRNLLSELTDVVIPYAAVPGNDKPVGWSELSGGWPQHYAVLLQLPDTGARLSGIDFVVELGPARLTLRQFYALLYCKHRLQDPDVLACGQRIASGPGNDAALVAFAKDFFLADRHRALRLPDEANAAPLVMRFTADWLATQLYEGRLNHLMGGPFAYTTPWDASNILGFPLNLRDVVPDVDQNDAHIEQLREQVVRAHAPLAVYARPVDRATSSVEIFVLNDGAAMRGTLRLVVGAELIWSLPVAVSAHHFARTAIDLKREPFASQAGRVANVQLVRDGETEPCSEYAIFLSDSDARR